MPRARSRTYDDWQTAAAEQKQGSGCLSGFILPPLAVLFISGFLALLALRQPIPAQALADLPTQPAAVTASAAPILPTSSPQEPAAQAVIPTNPPFSDLNGDGIPDAPPPPAQVMTQSQAAQPAVSNPQDLAPVQAATPTPIWNFFPNLQAAVSTALADGNSLPAAAPVASGEIASFFRPEVLHWKDSILRWSAAAGVDPNLAAVVMQIESCGDPRATSRSGAMGLFQVMPFHFRTGDDPYDPDTNAARGLAYLARSMSAANGDARLALAGYNGGIGVISRGEWTWPAETARYIYFGAPIYADASSGAVSSASLDEWYNRYGASLCRQASQHQ